MNDADILKIYLVMQKIVTEMLKLDDRIHLIAALGTAIDSWCKVKGEKPINVVNLLSSKVTEINTIYGEIGSGNHEF